MKIAICLFPLMDLGGIINHTEQLIGGFKDLGHVADILELSWRDRQPKSNSKQMDSSWETGPSGIPHHQGKGWNLPARNRIAYKGKWRMMEAKQKLETYDLVIWSVPVPTKNAEHKGNTDWPELYDLKKPKQIAIVHDGNCADACPHIMHIAHQLNGLACVHPCAYEGAGVFPVHGEMILNPQDLKSTPMVSWESRADGFISLQTFKAWKHVHELVEAIAYMPPRRSNEFRYVAGEGIEYRYMVSEEKCKPQYYHDNGKKFWDAAIENGMQRPALGFWSAREATEMLQNVKALVDPSWSKKYSKVGGHPNRVVVDAIRCGAIPVARALGMGSEIFKEGENYVGIPQDADAQEYADIVLSVGGMARKEVGRYRDANADKLQLFERGKIAKQYLNLMQQPKESWDNWDSDTEDKSEEVLNNFFGIDK